VLRTVGSDGRLELALGGMASPVEARLALVETLLKDASPATRSILRHIVQLPRGRKPLEALRDVQAIVADARDRVVAVVQTAAPLSTAQVTALAARLEQGYGRKISINQVVVPSLLGGVRITVGDDVIDGTVRARLDDLRLRLAG
jgi:F-type H+-transporting ATPase subunit delta